MKRIETYFTMLKASFFPQTIWSLLLPYPPFLDVDEGLLD
jgi:hypothetical protein